MVGSDGEALTIGEQLQRIRKSRRKSLRVIGGLAGMSASTLSRIENGLRPLDSRSETVALANALKIAPSELTRLPEPAAGNGQADAAVKAVRRAVIAVSRNRFDGQVLPVEVLRTRVQAVLVDGRQCRQAEVGAALPVLIQDLHTSIAAGRNVAELLDLAVLLHTQSSHAWLGVMGAEVDLRSQVALLARHAAEHRAEPAAMGLAVWGDVLVLLAGGDFDLAQGELNSVTVPTNSPDSTQLEGMLALSQSLVAAADRRPADVDAALEYAGELAERTGEGNAYSLGFGPTNVGLWRMSAVLEVGDYEQAAGIAKSLRPEVHPNQSRRAAYWINYGRALARLRGRQDDAVIAFHRAEVISPLHMHRNPFARDALAHLLMRSCRDAVGRELRGMAYRAGLPV